MGNSIHTKRLAFDSSTSRLRLKKRNFLRKKKLQIYSQFRWENLVTVKCCSGPVIISKGL